MWVVRCARRPSSVSRLQFALYCKSVGLLLALVALTELARLDSRGLALADRLSVVEARGGVAGAMILVGIGLVLGILERTAGGILAAVAIALTALGGVPPVLGTAWLGHGLLILRAPRREAGSRDRAAPLPRVAGYWPALAWLFLLAVPAAAVVFRSDSDSYRPLALLSAMALTAATAVFGPVRLTALASFVFVSIVVATAPESGRWAPILVPTLVAAMTHDWLPPRPAARGAPVVFFDGACALCSGAVHAIAGEDQRRALRFAPLGGSTCQVLLGQRDAAHDTLVLYDAQGIFERSDAALRIASYLGGVWLLAVPLRLVPKGVRDGVYGWIARHRYGWFGKLDSCATLTPELQRRLLE